MIASGISVPTYHFINAAAFLVSISETEKITSRAIVDAGEN
jgi:hypothetical protein